MYACTHVHVHEWSYCKHICMDWNWYGLGYLQWFLGLRKQSGNFLHTAMYSRSVCVSVVCDTWVQSWALRHTIYTCTYQIYYSPSLKNITHYAITHSCPAGVFDGHYALRTWIEAIFTFHFTNFAHESPEHLISHYAFCSTLMARLHET